MTAYVRSEPVLNLLDGEKEGLTTREVAAQLGATHMEAQNALRRLYMNDQVEIIRPSLINENKRWRIA